MPKYKQFDREQVLTQAMHLFWEQGYEATSIQDVIAATNLKPGSLYDTFGDKHGLFMAAVAHYRQTVIDPPLRALAAPGSARAAIKNYLALLQKGFSAPDGRFGCLMANSTVELAPHDKLVDAVVCDHVQRIELGFRQALERGVAQGEFSSATNPTMLGRFLVTCIVGLKVVSKSSEASPYLTDSLQVILGLLDSLDIVDSTATEQGVL